MLINILIGIAILIILYVGWYLFSHQNKTFFNKDATQNPRLAKILKNGGAILITVALIGAVSLITQNVIFMVVILLISTLVITFIQYLLAEIIFGK